MVKDDVAINPVNRLNQHSDYKETFDTIVCSTYIRQTIHVHGDIPQVIITVYSPQNLY